MEEIHREWEGAIELGSKFVFRLEELRSMRGTIQKRRRHDGDPAADERWRPRRLKQVVGQGVRK